MAAASPISDSIPPKAKRFFGSLAAGCPVVANRSSSDCLNCSSARPDYDQDAHQMIRHLRLNRLESPSIPPVIVHRRITILTLLPVEARTFSTVVLDSMAVRVRIGRQAAAY